MTKNRNLALAVFTYNRLTHSKRTIEALQKNTLASSIPLYIFSDGPKTDEDHLKIIELRNYLTSVDGFYSVSIIESNVNQGLAASIINGINSIFEQYKSVIVIEDDILTGCETLKYFSYMLEKYRDDKKVFSISANCETPRPFKLPNSYEYDIFFTHRMMCWGWATWDDRWKLCDWSVSDLEEFLESPSRVLDYENTVGADSLKRLKTWASGSLDVWSCRWIYAHYKHGAYCAVPVRSLSINIGRDGTGMNSGMGSNIKSQIETKFNMPPKLPESPSINHQVASAFILSFQSSRKKTLNYLLKVSMTLMKKIMKVVDDFILGQPDQKDLICFGTKYGGWLLPINALNENSIVITAGAGEDISFDFEIAKEFACEVNIYDPTPRAIEHFEKTKQLIKSQKLASINHSRKDFYTNNPSVLSKLKYYPYGLWNKNITKKFYVPAVKSHVSHSIANRHSTEKYFSAECLCLKTILERLSVEKLDLLKMDIEGAEYTVINNMFRSGIRPMYLLVEFHNGKSKLEAFFKPKTIIYVTLIRIFGYRLLARNNMDFVFVRAKDKK